MRESKLTFSHAFPAARDSLNPDNDPELDITIPTAGKKAEGQRAICVKSPRQEMMEPEFEPRPVCFQTLSSKSATFSPTRDLHSIQLIRVLLNAKNKKIKIKDSYKMV